MEHPVLLFDGVCNLCNHMVVFILRYENGNNIRFAPLQSEAAAKLLNQNKVKINVNEMNTIVFLYNGKIYMRGEAAFKIAGFLKIPFSLIAIFRFLPNALTNNIYDVISKYRYRIFGSRQQCMVPDAKWKDRFLK